MTLPWFRLYRELKDDPKVGFLDDAAFRVFIESLCWACEVGDNGRTGLNMQNVNWGFRRNVTETLQKLFQVGLLALNPEGEIVVPKWNERQKKSDSSSERVRKYRENHGVTLHETLPKRFSNGTEERRGEEKRSKQVATVPDSEWLASLSSNSAYAGMDLKSEHGKMSAWCEVNKKVPSRRRFINWINKAERPMNGHAAARSANAPTAEEVRRYAQEKWPDREPAKLATAYYVFWNDPARNWKRKDGRVVDWKIDFTEQVSKKATAP
jgi:hypothetical protein